MKFLVTSYHDPEDSRVIEAEGFDVDESGSIILLHKGKMIAKLINVNVEPLPSGTKQSSAKLSKLAAKYINFGSSDLGRLQVTNKLETLFTDIRSLAASVLSQDETGD